MNYTQWCEKNKNLTPLVRALKSSYPEQCIGFYLQKVFGDEIEYQKQFEWLGRHSLDIYIPSLNLAVEYDGVYYHSNKSPNDTYKTSICRSYGVYLIHIQEKTKDQSKSSKENEISYYYKKGYKNIDIAITELCLLINKRYNLSINIDVDINRDKNELISYVQCKYYKKSIAYIWPESKDYWLEDVNGLSIFDVFTTDNRVFMLKCPHCQQRFRFFMRYSHDRKSFIPCDCEYKNINKSFEEAIRKYKETGEVVVLDNSLDSRRLYDKMALFANRIWRCESKEEAELYKKLGFTSPYIDVYLSQFSSPKD